MPFTYDEEAARNYDLAVPLMPGEVDFYLPLAERARDAGLRTLELACGTGRVAIPLARAGIPLLGIDNAPAMLARARDKSATLENVEWREGDMRSPDLGGERFGFIFIAAGTFQMLLEPEDQLACLRGVREHLAPEGRLSFNVEGIDTAAIEFWRERRGTFVRRPQRDFVDPDTGFQRRAWTSVEYHPSTQRYTSHGMHEEVDAEGTVVRKRYGQSMELRYFSRFELEHLLARTGLDLDALYAGFDKSPYRAATATMLLLARPATHP